MRILAKKYYKFMGRSIRLAFLCLFFIMTGACVSQKPKTDSQTPEQNTASQEAAQGQQPTAQTSSTGEVTTDANTGDSASVQAVSEKPELIAFYKRSPQLKEYVAILLHPLMFELPATGRATAGGATVTGNNTGDTSLSNADSGNKNTQGTVSSTAPETGQQAANTSPPTGQAGSSATGTAGSNGSAPGTAGTAQGNDENTQGTSSTGTYSGTATGAAGTNTATQTKTGTSASAGVQPQIPFAPASSSSALVAPQNTQVPVMELTVEKNKTFTVIIPGNGWIYLGDEYSRQGVRYESRQLVDNTIVYRLNSDRTGDFLLRFQRDNPVTQLLEVSYIRVIVVDVGQAATSASVSASGSQTTGTSAGSAQGAGSAVSGTPYTSQSASAGATQSAGNQVDSAQTGSGQTSIAQSNTSQTGAAQTTSGQTGAAQSNTSQTGSNQAGSAQTSVNPQISPGSGQGIPPGTSIGASSAAGTSGGTASTAGSANVSGNVAGPSAQYTHDAINAITDATAVLEIARTQLAQKQVATVLSALNRYMVLNPSGSDEVLYLYALAYEQDTPYRDIQKAYSYYKQLVREYPLSTYRQYALERIAYMERYYPGLR